MQEADSVHSTPPINTSATRRRFLSQSAGLAAGGAILALATIPPAAAASAPAGLAANPDPVFALIQAHRAADDALTVACVEKSRLEELGCWDTDIDTKAAHEAEWSAVCDLVEAVPTTLAGVIVSMRYIAELADGNFARFGQGEVAPLLTNLAEALTAAVTS